MIKYQHVYVCNFCVQEKPALVTGIGGVESAAICTDCAKIATQCFDPGQTGRVMHPAAVDYAQAEQARAMQNANVAGQIMSQQANKAAAGMLGGEIIG